MQPQGASESIVGATGNVVVTATPDGLAGLDSRHPSVRHFAPLFAYGHLPAHLRGVSELLAVAAAKVCNMLRDGVELSAGLRRLVEAKDCLVRQAVMDRREAS